MNFNLIDNPSNIPIYRWLKKKKVLINIDINNLCKHSNVINSQPLDLLNEIIYNENITEWCWVKMTTHCLSKQLNDSVVWGKFNNSWNEIMDCEVHDIGHKIAILEEHIHHIQNRDNFLIFKGIVILPDYGCKELTCRKNETDFRS